MLGQGLGLQPLVSRLFFLTRRKTAPSGRLGLNRSLRHPHHHVGDAVGFLLVYIAGLAHTELGLDHGLAAGAAAAAGAQGGALNDGPAWRELGRMSTSHLVNLRRLAAGDPVLRPLLLWCGCLHGRYRYPLSGALDTLGYLGVPPAGGRLILMANSSARPASKRTGLEV